MLTGLRSLIPPGFSARNSSALALQRLFADRDATAQLRRAWPDLGFGGHIGQHQTDGDLRTQLDRAVHAQRLALLWLPDPPHIDHRANAEYVKARTPAPILAAAGAQPSGAPALALKPPKPGVQGPHRPVPVSGSPPTPASGAQAVQPAKRPVSVLSPVERIEAALSGSLNHVGPELRRRLSALTVAGVVNEIAIFCLALAIAQVTGVGAAAIDSALLAYAWYVAGWTGLQAIFQLVTASVTAMKASNDRELDDASRQYAQAFILLGEALLAAILARVQAKAVEAKAARATKPSSNATTLESFSTESDFKTRASNIRRSAQLGKEGEAAVRSEYEIGEKSKILVDGRVRIPDGLTRTTLSEVKNVKQLSFTQQLRDYLTYAKEEGLDFDLYTRSDTSLSEELLNAIRRGDINPKIIPGT